MSKTLFALSQNRSKNICKLCSFLYQFLPLTFCFRRATGIYKLQPICAFFSFLSTYLYAH